MPSLDLTTPLFNVQGGAATDWGSVAGNAQILFRAAGQLKRGIDLDIGIEALAQFDAAFRKYLAADLNIRGQASAKLRGQVQVPINLFDEVGLAIRLQAVAQAAVGISVRVGLNMQDFIELAKADERIEGLPYDLLIIFLEEITVQAGVFGKAAFSAMAYANLVVTGRLLDDDVTGEKAGFNILGEIGAGFKGGTGWRLFATLGFENPRRYVSRTVDVVVDAAIDEIIKKVPETDTQSPVLLDAMRAPSKIALRVSYDLGEYLATQNVPRTAEGAQKIALRCSQIILEEIQRYFLNRMVEYALRELDDYLRDQQTILTDAQWDSLINARQTLAAHLYNMPREPFALKQSNFDYWNRLVNDASNLALDFAQLSGASLDQRTLRLLSILWAGSQLAFVSMRRFATADVSVSVVGFTVGAAHGSFSGTLDFQPRQEIGDFVRSQLDTPPAASEPLMQEHLLLFLAHDVVLDPLRQRFPDVDEFIHTFQGPISGAENDIARLLVMSIGAITVDSSGQLDNQATLAALLQGLNRFLDEKIETVIAPAVRPYVADDPHLLRYFDEVMLPTLHFASDVTFAQVLQWQTSTVTDEQLKEALSAVLMMLLGRSLVVTTDILWTAASKEISRALRDAADHVEDPGGIADILEAHLPDDDREDIIEIMRETLLIGSDVFEPLPDDTRARMRALMYEIVEPLPPGGAESFMHDLGDSFFIPNGGDATQLAHELTQIAGDHFAEFVQRVLVLVGEKVVEESEEFSTEIRQLVEQWIQQLEEAIAQLFEDLQQLAADIQQLIVEVNQLVIDTMATIDNIGEAVSGTALLETISEAVAGRYVQQATPLLTQNTVYQNIVPSDQKSTADSAMATAIQSALVTPVLAPLSGALESVADNIAELVDDVRGLDPEDDLESAIMDLVLDRVENAILQGFTSDNPSIPVSFTVSWQYPFAVYEPPAGYRIEMRTATHTINLGNVSVPLTAILTIVRASLEQLEWLGTLVTDVAGQLFTTFEKEFLLTEAENTRTNTRQEYETLRDAWEESLPQPRTVAVLSPKDQQVYEHGIKLRIRLTRVPESFLGVGENTDHIQRVFVFLNGNLLENDEFAVDRMKGPPGNNHTSLSLETMSAAPMDGVDNSWELEKHWVIDDAISKRAANANRTQRRDSKVLKSRRADRATRQPAKPSALERRRKQIAKNPIAAGAKGGSQSAGPGLLLEREFAPKELVEGINSLLVLLVDGRETQLEKAVIFVATKPSATKPKGRKPVRLPTRKTGRPYTIRKLRPQDFGSAGFLPPKRKRRAAMETAREQVRKKKSDPRRLRREPSEKRSKRV